MYVVNIGSRLTNQPDIAPVHFLSYVTLQIINNINRNVFVQGKTGSTGSYLKLCQSKIDLRFS